jgi:hypothetical protein
MSSFNDTAILRSLPSIPQLSRRGFLFGCAACTACAGAGLRPLASFAIDSGSTSSFKKLRLRLVFTHIDPKKPTWPYQGYDYEGRKKELTERLVGACPNVEFLPATAINEDQAKDLLGKDSGVDGYLVYMVGIWSGAPRVFAFSGRPTLLVDDLYAGTGEFLIVNAEARRQGMKVAGVSSSRFEDVVRGVHAFEALKKLQQSVIVDVSDNDQLWGNPQELTKRFGTEIRKMSSRELNAAYQKADAAQARRQAETWMREAEKVVEPSREEIQKSASMYQALQALMKQHQAQAIAVDCLGLFYTGKLPAYPCLGFFQLNNDGLVGACEGDLPSTVSMLLFTYLAGRPGMISDPVIDTSKNQIIYAHCVAPSKVYGPAGPTNPYQIRSHSEDRKGAAIRALLPLGEMTTTIEVDASKNELILHQAKTVENIDEDKACRTKLAAEVKGDIQKLLSEWDRWGWHRVTCYGDQRQIVEVAAGLLGMKVTVEA